MSLLIGAYIWIVGLLVVFLPHSHWVIGTILGLLGLSTVGIVFATLIIDKLQLADDNLLRVHQRLGFATVDADPEDYGKKLETTLLNYKRPFAYNMLYKFSQDICRNRNPLCNACPVSSCCASYARNEKLIQA